jgi:hypothetical protein
MLFKALTTLLLTSIAFAAPSLSTRAIEPCAPNLYILSDFNLTTSPTSAFVDFNFIALYPSNVGIEDPVSQLHNPYSSHIYFRRSCSAPNAMPRAPLSPTTTSAMHRAAVYCSTCAAQRRRLTTRSRTPGSATGRSGCRVTTSPSIRLSAISSTASACAASFSSSSCRRMSARLLVGLPRLEGLGKSRL